MGNKIAASTVSRYLARAKPHAKVAQDQEPEELTDNNWREERAEMVERSQDDC